VVFVDDYSRFTWICPLRTKSEIFDTLLKFKLIVENQFFTTIIQLQLDGESEYTSLHFDLFHTFKAILNVNPT
jgi:hypothetical protein